MYRGSRDTGYLPFYFQGYGILCSIFLSTTFRNMGYLGGYLSVYMGLLPVYFEGYGILVTQLYKPHQ